MNKFEYVQNFLLICLSLMVFQLVIPFSLLAVEYPADSTEQEDVVYQDEATKTIQEMVEKGEPHYEPVKDAKDLADKYLEDNQLHESWNEEKKIFIAVGEAVFDSEDPSYDNSFITKRSLKSMEAILDAKAKIIEYVQTKMSALDKAVTPGTDINAKFKEDIERSQKRMEAQKMKVAKLLEDVDQAQAEALRGATFGDRLNSLMDAAIAKLDQTYSVEKIEAKKREKYEKAKARYEESSNELKELEKKIAAYTGTITETLSTKVETMSKMPLFGAVPVAQFESWCEEEEQFKVAIVVLWSSKMERVARAFITGEDFKVPPGNISLREWIKNQDWSTATGGRRFRDSSGTVHFVGIAASPVGKSSSSEKRARGMSEQFAKKEVAMAIFSDVESYKKAEAMMQTRSGGAGKDVSNAVDSFASTISQKIKNRQIHGLQKLYGKKLVHPISQQKMYVSIYSLSGNSAKQALLMQERNYLTKILDVKSQQKMKGTTDAYKSKVKEAEADQSEYRKARSGTGQKIDNSISREHSPKSEPSSARNSSSGGYHTDDQRGGKSRSGAYSGGGQGDLSW